MPRQTKILTRAALTRRLAPKVRRGRKVVFTNGCFDLLHPGHVRYLRAARAHDRDAARYPDESDHQPDHAGQLVIRHQRTDDEGRDHRRPPAERITDAVGTQPDLGRKQFRRVDAEQDRGLHIDRDDQHGADNRTRHERQKANGLR